MCGGGLEILCAVLGKVDLVVADTVVVWEVFAWTNSNDSRALIVDVFVACSTDRIHSDGFDLLVQFQSSDTATVGKHLATEFVADGSSAITGKRKGSLELVLGARNVWLIDGLAQAHPFNLQFPREFFNLHGVENSVGTPEAGVRVRREERCVLVCPAMFCGDARQWRRQVFTATEGAVPVAHDL